MTTKIEWTDSTWNPIVGCSKISEGCANCYAVKMAYRLACMGKQEYQMVCNTGCEWEGKTEFVLSAIEKPLHWKKPRKIFVCSMGDLFHDSIPNWQRNKVFNIIEACPQHTFQFLTKRAHSMLNYFQTNRKRYSDNPLKNVWLGVTAENQQRADERIPILLQIPAAKRFVSCEPLLGEINLWRNKNSDMKSDVWDGKEVYVEKLDWVIVGCETGHNARPCKIEWIESIVEQCKSASVPVFVKSIPLQESSFSGCRSTCKNPFFRTAEDVRLMHGEKCKPRLIVCKDVSKWPEHLRLRELPKDLGKGF